MSAITNEREFSEPPSSTEIIEGRLYLGNLASSLDLEYRAKLGITHVVCVCPEGLEALTPPTDLQNADVKAEIKDKNDRFLYIPVEDNEYEDILTHLPLACAFIEKSLISPEVRVLVHCKMGVSRSVTVIAAYLMKSKRMKSFDAVEYIKARRSQIHPNYGFLKQLEKFEQCNHTAPSPRNPAYRSWKRKYVQDVQSYLEYAGDVVSIGTRDGEAAGSSGSAVYLASDLPEDLQQSRHLLREFEVTHIVLIGSNSAECEVKAAASELGLQIHEVADLSCVQSGWEVVGGEVDEEWLETSVSGVCTWIQAAGKRERNDSQGNVLVYSPNEARACVVICAYLMASRKLTAKEALSILQRHLPLFSPSQPFLRQLEALDRLNGNPSYPNTAPLAVSPSSLPRTPVAASLL